MRRLILALIGLVALAAPTAADDFAFKPARHAFLPELTVSKDDAVCRPFLAALTAAFKGPDFRINLAGSTWSGAEVRWIFPIPEADKAKFLLRNVPFDAPADDYPTQVEALPVDLDHDGKEEVLANIYWLFNSNSDSHALALYRSRSDFDRTMQSTDRVSSKLFAGAIQPARDERLLSGGTTVLTTGVDRQVVAINGGYYVVSRGEGYQDDAVFGLWRINADASTTETCEALALPERDGVSLGTLRSGPVDTFAKLVAAASGKEGNTGGTLHAHTRLLIEADRVLSRVAIRPWVLDKAELYNSRAVVEQDLDAWSRSSLYAFRIRCAWPAQEAAARDALAAHYQTRFGLAPEAAGRAAAGALDALVRSHFVFRADGIPVLPDRPYRGLTRALLQGAPRAEIESLLEDGYRIRTHFNLGTDDEDGRSVWGYFTEEPTLFYALENPINVAVLLRAGADPNARGDFDKTALMYAAQFDLVDTAKVLLASGAAVNAVTRGSGNDGYLTRFKRAALMYAAENASPEMIRLLLARGADATATDATRHGVLYYLGLNQRLSAEERTAMTTALMEAGAIKP